MPYGSEFLDERVNRALAGARTQAGPSPIPFGQVVNLKRPRPELADKGAKTPPAGKEPFNDVTSYAVKDEASKGSVSYGKPGVYSIWGKSNL